MAEGDKQKCSIVLLYFDDKDKMKCKENTLNERQQSNKLVIIDKQQFEVMN